MEKYQLFAFLIIPTQYHISVVCIRFGILSSTAFCKKRMLSLALLGRFNDNTLCLNVDFALNEKTIADNSETLVILLLNEVESTLQKCLLQNVCRLSATNFCYFVTIQ